MELATLTVRMYHAPNGRREDIEITRVYEADAAFFKENNIVVSMEELMGDYIVYACPESDVSEESEVIAFANGRSCEETLDELAQLARKEFVEKSA